MNRIASRYITAHFLRAGTVALFLLLALFGFLTLAEALEDVGAGAFTTYDAITTTAVSVPRLIIDLLPITVLLAGVLGLGGMANHQELVALRAAGLSQWGFARTLVMIAVGISVAALLMLFYVVPAAEQQAQELRKKTTEQIAGGGEFWSRRGNRIIRVGAVDFGRIPRALELYELDDEARLVRLITADRADIVAAGEWRLHDVHEKKIEHDQVLERYEPMKSWASFLTPAQVATLITPSEALSPLDLYRYLKQTRGSGIDTHEQESRLWQQLSLPIAVVAMSLITLPLVMLSVRPRSAGFRVLIGGILGIAFYLFQQITAHLSVLLDLPPAPVALAPPLLVIGIAVLWLARTSPRR